MNTLIISGVSAGGTITPGPNQGIQIESIELAISMDDTSDPSVTLSGATTGVYTFHNSISPHLRFYKDEAVTVSSTNFSGEYSAAINYLTWGSQNYYKEITKSAGQFTLPAGLTSRRAYDSARGLPTN